MIETPAAALISRELATDPELTCEFLKMGYDELSVSRHLSLNCGNRYEI
jgi:phosphoenolpyruvate-protein kinase (PTS system EI component)